jgi:hypothetical protein
VHYLLGKPGAFMKLFVCDHCGNTVYFENAVCERCGHRLGYVPHRNALVSLIPDNDQWSTPAFPGEAYIFCDNARHGACNWLVPAMPGGDIYCAACRHNDTIPALTDPRNLSRWQVIERAKKRLFYSLLRPGSSTAHQGRRPRPWPLLPLSGRHAGGNRAGFDRA